MASKAGKAAERRFEADFTKEFGEGSLHTGKEALEYEVISTGSIELDIATGVGGLVEGRLTEFWGADGVGKSTMALLAAAEAQVKYPDKRVGWVDMEYSIDLPWVDSHGVDRDRWYHYQPRSSEDVADAMKKMATSGLFSLIVLDSIGGMIPDAEMEKDADEAVVGKQALVVTRMVKTLTGVAGRTGTAVLLINQVRANLGYGADTTTPGGFALKHSTTHKMKFRKSGAPKKMKIDGDEVQVGQELAIRMERNRVAPPGRTANVMLLNQSTEKFGPIGVDKVDEAFEVGTRFGIIDRSGAYYTLPVTGERLQGRDDTIKALRSTPEVVAHIRTAAIDALKGVVHEESDEGAEATPDFRTSADD